MTRDDILQAIKKVDRIAGMTTNERLFATGLMNEFDNTKFTDQPKAKFILEQLQLDKPSIDLILNSVTLKKFIGVLLLTACNISLTVFLISVLADNLMKYEKAFWVTLPLVITFTYLLGKSIHKHSIAKNTNLYLLYVLSIVILILNVLILAINYYCWIDLFDGTTQTMFP